MELANDLASVPQKFFIYSVKGFDGMVMPLFGGNNMARNYEAFDINGKAIGVKFGRTERKYNTATRQYDVLESIGYTAYFTKEAGCIRISCKGITVYARENKDGGIALSYRVKTMGYEAEDATLVSDKAKGNYNAVKKYLLAKYNFKDMKYATLESNLIEALRDIYEAKTAKSEKEAC